MTKYILIGVLLFSCAFAQELDFDLNKQTTMITEVSGDTVTVFPSKGQTQTYIGDVKELFDFIKDTSYLRLVEVQNSYNRKVYTWRRQPAKVKR
jgi:hypothetical protein